MIYKRKILDQVILSTKEYPITLVTGARQVGKTTLVSYFEKEMNYKYISFDDSEILEEAKKSAKEFLKKYGTHLIIDEVQKYEEIFIEIEKNVNEKRRIDGSFSANGMYILTGSEKFSLMKNVSESMLGRVGIIEMQTLSQAEIRGWESSPFTINNEKLFNISNNRNLTEDELYESIVRGFYPARWEILNQPIKNYYSNYIKTYIERDVLKLINLKDKLKFENFLKVIAASTGQELIINNIAKVVGIDNKTVLSWITIVLTSDIISLLSPFNESSINKQIVKRQKLYFSDTGLACYLLGIDTPKTLFMSSFKGRIIETYIYNEIRKSYLNENIPFNAFYYRDKNQNEIDLIILNDGKLDLIESKSGKNFGSSSVKGFKALENTSYDINGKCLICTALEPYKISSNIYAYPLNVI